MYYKYVQVNVNILLLKASIQTDLAALLKKFEGDVYAWMRQRIVGTWTYWISAIEELRLMEHFQERKRKKVQHEYLNITLAMDVQYLHTKIVLL